MATVILATSTGSRHHEDWIVAAVDRWAKENAATAQTLPPVHLLVGANAYIIHPIAVFDCYLIVGRNAPAIVTNTAIAAQQEVDKANA